MTETSRRDYAESRGRLEPPTAWSGWVVFAGAMMILLGSFHVIQALVAFFDDGFYLVGSEGLVVDVDYNTWGWAHLILGAIGILVGVGLCVGNLAARIAGVGVAFLSAVVNLAFISAYPVWSTIMITFNVIVIYAIIVHGRELKENRESIYR